MHIPDGFLSPRISLVTWGVALAGVSFCLKKTAKTLKDRMIPLMGVMSAFVFAAQMLNFPVIGGTSGHLLGGVLASVLLGPYAGAIVLTCILTVQCFIFQDGGITALGANILNMAFIGALGGYFLYRIVSRILGGNRGIVVGA
ncbi:cobalamin biosynthesis protein CbiM, partial [bacterium]